MVAKANQTLIVVIFRLNRLRKKFKTLNLGVTKHMGILRSHLNIIRAKYGGVYNNLDWVLA